MGIFVYHFNLISLFHMLRFLQFLKDYIALCQEILSRPDPEAEAE